MPPKSGEQSLQLAGVNTTCERVFEPEKTVKGLPEYRRNTPEMLKPPSRKSVVRPQSAAPTSSLPDREFVKHVALQRMTSVEVRTRIVQIAVVDIKRRVGCRLSSAPPLVNKRQGRIERACVFGLGERVACLESESLRRAPADLNLKCVVTRTIVAVDHVHCARELRIRLEVRTD